ncbi:MAG: hypothetical protein KAR79_04040 [Simkaniaceae bacterium]|nr:hypothetical protein [Simkaniaceae bacterium]
MAAGVTGHTASRFIVNQQPSKFGGFQVDWEEKSQAIISQMGGKMRMLRMIKREDYKPVFYTLLEEFERLRGEIAHQHETPAAEKFGMRRDRIGTPPFHQTFLDREYQGYGKKLLRKQYMHYLRNLDGATSKSWSYEDSKVEVEIFRKEDVRLDPSTFPKTPPGASKSERDLATRCFKIKHPKEFQVYKRFAMLQTIERAYPSSEHPKSFFVSMKIRHLIEGKMYLMTEFLSWGVGEPTSDTFVKMPANSSVCMVHMDKLLINETLPKVAEVFDRIMKWDGGDQKNLKEMIAEFKWRLAPCMPDDRGTSSIAEWFEQSSNVSYGLEQVKYDDSQMMDLEALITGEKAKFVTAYVDGKFFV